jgi:hypothetical protein
MTATILLLGDGNDRDGQLTPVATQRCRLALDLCYANPNSRVLLTGGHGLFNAAPLPHAHYLRQYLFDHELPDYQVFDELILSSSTKEAVSMSARLIENNNIKSIFVVTSDFNIERARYFLENELFNKGIDILFVPSLTNPETCGFDLDERINYEIDALDQACQTRG